MRRVAMKALFTMLASARSEGSRINWDRNVVIFSTTVTVGLVVLYFYGRATARW